MENREPTSIFYSDAAFEPGKDITYGWVLVIPGQTARSGSGVVPSSVSRQFRARKTQILVGELLGALSGVFSCSDALRNGRLLHFVDNQPAVATLIGGKGTDPDVAAIACVYQLLLTALGVSAWLEFVESESNLADGPSRLLADWLHSPEARMLRCTHEPARLPDLTDLIRAPIHELAALGITRRLLDQHLSTRPD